MCGGDQLESISFTIILFAEVPASKVAVGLAKAPEVRNVKSKIGSLNNIQHKPGKQIDTTVHWVHGIVFELL